MNLRTRKEEKKYTDPPWKPIFASSTYFEPLTDEQELADDLSDGDEAEVVALDDLQDEADGVGDLEGGQDEHRDEPEEDGAGELHVDAHEQGELFAVDHWLEYVLRSVGCANWREPAFTPIVWFPRRARWGTLQKMIYQPAKLGK